jgi:hypothetical protein
MGLLKYLDGVAARIIGLLLIIFGIFVNVELAGNFGVGIIFIIAGILILVTGRYHSK